MAFGKRGIIGRAIRWIIGVVAFAAILVVGVTIAINVYTIQSTRDDVHTIAQIEESGAHADAILVLGASVHPDGTPSDMLEDRLQVACDLYFSQCASKLIVSGDNRTTHYNESDNMKAYCVEAGVPSYDVLVDHAGYDTYSSVYRTWYVYGAQKVMIVTQAYHLYRALMIAHLLGMDAQGVAADMGYYDDQTMYSLREAFARDKDFFQAWLKLPPEDTTQPITQ